MLLLGLHLSLLKLSLGGELLFHCIVSKIPLRLTQDRSVGSLIFHNSLSCTFQLFLFLRNTTEAEGKLLLISSAHGPTGGQLSGAPL